MILRICFKRTQSAKSLSPKPARLHVHITYQHYRTNSTRTHRLHTHNKQAREAFGKEVATGFSEWAWIVLDQLRGSLVGTGGLGWAVQVLSSLLENPAVINPDDLVALSREIPHDWLSTCFLETMASVENPFVAGTTLSVALSKAAVLAPHGERRNIVSLQNKLDNLLLEILERLPQTVQGFHGGMAGCAAVFEPEVEAGDARGFPGPLWMLHQSRRHMETFCGQPLIVEFLARRFTYGLPHLLGNITSAPDLPSLVHGAAHCPCLVIDVKDKFSLTYAEILGPGHILDSLFSPCFMLQGVENSTYEGSLKVFSLSVLPGVQFLTAGLVAKPEAYYGIPELRVVLGVVVTWPCWWFFV